jgi:hypothetical protein
VEERNVIEFGGFRHIKGLCFGNYYDYKIVIDHMDSARISVYKDMKDKALQKSAA